MIFFLGKIINVRCPMIDYYEWDRGGWQRRLQILKKRWIMDSEISTIVSS